MARQEAQPAVTMNPTFEFPLLLPQSQQIRLVKLLHRPKSKLEIRCSLIVDELRQELKYTALSYAWGKRSINKIIVNNECYFVHDNLFDFLALQSTDSEFCSNTYLWIDQICIHQENLVERNHQVDLMARIYEFATETIIWLGRPGKDNDMDDGNLTWVMQTIRDPPPVPHPSVAAVRSPPSGLRHSSYPTVGLKNFGEYPLFSLILLSSCGYWNRLWIIQEILLSRRLKIKFYGHMICWNDLEQVYNNCISFIRVLHAEHIAYWKLRYGSFSTSEDFCEVFERDLGTLNELVRFRQNMRTDEFKWRELTWKQAVELVPLSECEDLHDKIFGLMRLVRASLRFPADYSKRMEEIYDQVLASEI